MRRGDKWRGRQGDLRDLINTLQTGSGDIDGLSSLLLQDLDEVGRVDLSRHLLELHDQTGDAGTHSAGRGHVEDELAIGDRRDDVRGQGDDVSSAGSDLVSGQAGQGDLEDDLPALTDLGADDAGRGGDKHRAGDGHATDGAGRVGDTSGGSLDTAQSVSDLLGLGRGLVGDGRVEQDDVADQAGSVHHEGGGDGADGDVVVLEGVLGVGDQIGVVGQQGGVIEGRVVDGELDSPGAGELGILLLQGTTDLVDEKESMEI